MAGESKKDTLVNKLREGRQKRFMYLGVECRVILGSRKEFEEHLAKVNDLLTEEDKTDAHTQFALAHIVDEQSQQLFTKEEFMDLFTLEQSAEFLKLFNETYMPTAKAVEKN